MSHIRNTIGRMLDERIRRSLTPFEVSSSAASSVVFAPHPDDETLGCGGVAHKLIASGTRVEFVFVTDGAASHSAFLASDLLRRTRENEAIEAVVRLGASARQVTFLRFPDGHAMDHVLEMSAAIVPLLQHWQPRSVFVTHAQEPPADHVAVNTAVWKALHAYGRSTTVFEYPVWYWHQWPWTRWRGDLPGISRQTLRQTMRTFAGLRAISTFNTQVYVGDVLDVKKNALAAHASQMKQPVNDPSWPTLPDISNGTFLKRFLGDYEIFTRYEVNAKRA